LPVSGVFRSDPLFGLADRAIRRRWGLTGAA
jgi:hypothetical protein